MAQRTGPISITAGYDDDDLPMLRVPQEAVGFRDGERAGNFLSTVEEE